MIKVYLENTKGDYKATGMYNEKTNELKLLSGSKVFLDVPYIESFNTDRIINQRYGKIDDDIVIDNIMFKSPSTAGSFVTGRSCNGLTAWKDKEGRSIKELIGKKSDK